MRLRVTFAYKGQLIGRDEFQATAKGDIARGVGTACNRFRSRYPDIPLVGPDIEIKIGRAEGRCPSAALS